MIFLSSRRGVLRFQRKNPEMTDSLERGMDERWARMKKYIHLTNVNKTWKKKCPTGEEGVGRSRIPTKPQNKEDYQLCEILYNFSAVDLYFTPFILLLTIFLCQRDQKQQSKKRKAEYCVDTRPQSAVARIPEFTASFRCFFLLLMYAQRGGSSACMFNVPSAIWEC